jgi:hypothetical protein
MMGDIFEFPIMQEPGSFVQCFDRALAVLMSPTRTFHPKDGLHEVVF